MSLLKRIISICVLLFSSAIAFSAEFSLKIEFPEMGETLDPFVTIINEQGENTVIANKNGAMSYLILILYYPKIMFQSGIYLLQMSKKHIT